MNALVVLALAEGVIRLTTKIVKIIKLQKKKKAKGDKKECGV